MRLLGFAEVEAAKAARSLRAVIFRVRATAERMLGAVGWFCSTRSMIRRDAVPQRERPRSYGTSVSGTAENRTVNSAVRISATRLIPFRVL